MKGADICMFSINRWNPGKIDRTECWLTYFISDSLAFATSSGLQKSKQMFRRSSYDKVLHFCCIKHDSSLTSCCEVGASCCKVGVAAAPSTSESDMKAGNVRRTRVINSVRHLLVTSELLLAPVSPTKNNTVPVLLTKQLKAAVDTLDTRLRD